MIFGNVSGDKKLAVFLGVSKNLPELAQDNQTFQLNSFYTEKFPKLKNSKWFLAIGDGAANNLGADCVTNDKAALMIGTSGAMRVCYTGEPPKKLPNGLWCYRIDRKRILIGGALSDGGGLYGWLKDTLKLVGTDDEIEDKIAEKEPDSHGLTFLPFLAGERSTGWHASAQGAILGLHSATDSIDITQAALESVAYRFAEIFDQLNAVFKIKTIIASGGALRESPVWSQMITDVLNQKMSLPDVREASSQGVVNLALEAIGKNAKLEKEDFGQQSIFEPNIEKYKVYKEARKRHRYFYDLLCK